MIESFRNYDYSRVPVEEDQVELLEDFEHLSIKDDVTPEPEYQKIAPKISIGDLFRRQPRGIDEDHPGGRSMASVASAVGLVALFSSGAMIFPVPLNISLSQDAGLCFKNLCRIVEQLFLNKAQAANEEGANPERVVKIVKYLLLGGILGGCGGVDLFRFLQHDASLQLSAKAGGIVSMALERDLVEYYRPQKVVGANGKKEQLHLATWKKAALLLTTYSTGTLGIYFEVSPVLSSGLLNATNVTIKSLAKQHGWKKCVIALGAANVCIAAGAGLGFALEGMQSLPYSAPFMMSILKVDLTAVQRIALQKLTGDDGEDDTEEEAKDPPTSLRTRSIVLAAGIAFSLAAIYLKFATQNSSTASVANYALGLLMDTPLKFTGRLAYNVMQELPRTNVITPGVGISLLAAEGVSYPFQSHMPIVAVVFFTVFAAIASRLIESTIKGFLLGEKKKPAS